MRFIPANVAQKTFLNADTQKKLDMPKPFLFQRANEVHMAFQHTDKRCYVYDPAQQRYYPIHDMQIDHAHPQNKIMAACDKFAADFNKQSLEQQRQYLLEIKALIIIDEKPIFDPLISRYFLYSKENNIFTANLLLLKKHSYNDLGNLWLLAPSTNTTKQDMEFNRFIETMKLLPNEDWKKFNIGNQEGCILPKTEVNQAQVGFGTAITQLYAQNHQKHLQRAEVAEKTNLTIQQTSQLIDEDVIKAKDIDLKLQVIVALTKSVKQSSVDWNIECAQSEVKQITCVNTGIITTEKWTQPDITIQQPDLSNMSVEGLQMLIRAANEQILKLQSAKPEEK